jgi:hypothetical protein
MSRGTSRARASVDGVLEVYGGIGAGVLARLPLAGGAAAITLGHVVIARDRGLLTLSRRHERVHVRQYESGDRSSFLRTCSPGRGPS